MAKLGHLCDLILTNDFPQPLPPLPLQFITEGLDFYSTPYLFEVNSFLIAITNSFKDSWLKKAKNNYVRTYVSSKESLTTTTSIKWDTLILCVSYLSLYLASSRTGRIDIVDRPRCTGTISTVRYKHIQTPCSPTTDGDRYTLIWYPVLLSHIYFVRFKNLAKGFIRHPAFLKYFLLNFFLKKLQFWG